MALVDTCFFLSAGNVVAFGQGHAQNEDGAVGFSGCRHVALRSLFSSLRRGSKLQ